MVAHPEKAPAPDANARDMGPPAAAHKHHMRGLNEAVRSTGRPISAVEVVSVAP